MRKIIDQLYDNGSLQTTALDLSQDDWYLVTGSSSGIIKVYDIMNRHKLIKEYQNLTTKVSGLTFNSSSELIVGWS